MDLKRQMCEKKSEQKVNKILETNNDISNETNKNEDSESSEDNSCNNSTKKLSSQDKISDEMKEKEKDE
jgi:hypothetical protein